VHVHALFLLLLGFVGLNNWLNSGSLAQAVDGVLYILALFACVLLHEFGHSLAARQFGIPTRDITLLPHAVVEGALAGADAPEVEAEGGRPHIARRPAEGVDDIVAHLAAVLRVRVRDNNAGAGFGLG